VTSSGAYRFQNLWRVSVDGSPVVVELLPYSGRLWGAPSSFSVGGVERQLEQPPGTSRRERVKTPLSGSIDVGEHRLTMTRTTITLTIRSAMRRALFGVRRSGPLAFLGTLVGGAGLGGGMAAASQTTLSWLVYAVDVDGKPKGSWVGKTVDGVVEQWTWVPPGGDLPDRRTLEFPRSPARA
jgi:hypothetical protein